MKKLSISAGLLLLPIACACFATPAQAQEAIQHAPDGHTVEHIDSIEIPTITNAPFSAVVVTELTRILPDGSEQTTWNHRTIARDSSGRVFQERRAFTPNGNIETTRLGQLQYDDPNLHERELCSQDLVCRTYSYNFPLPPQDASLPPIVTLPNGNTIRNEGLGSNNIEGVDVVGSRETTSIPAGVMGNQRSEDIVKEFWYSPRLGINIVTKRINPSISSIQNFQVTKIDLSEPDPKLFQPPANYRRVSMREN